MKRYSLLLLPLLLFLLSFSTDEVEKTVKPPFLLNESPWADSTFQQMNLDQKLGQLFNVAAYSNKGEEHRQQILALIKDYHIGGLTFFQGGPMRQAQLSNIYQQASEIPLMVAIDGEWGLSMRLDSTVKYPWQMTLGAIENDSLIYEMGLQIAEQFRRLGVHVNFAPVVDVNNNPNNPVIFARSFGEQRKNVAEKATAYMQGMQAGKLLANAKHFPGHGDTDVDSHISLPVVDYGMGRLDSIELYPFKKLIAEGVGSMMTAHLYLPQLSPAKKASSLSSEIVDTLLKQKMGFEGLIFTDGLNMGGVAKYQTSQEIDLQALLAGNDVLLLSQDVPKAIELIKEKIQDGHLSMKAIDQSVLKILKAKEWLGIHQKSQVDLNNLLSDLNHPKYENLHRKLVEHSLTVLKNKNQKLPIKELKNKRIIALAFAEKGISYRPFQEMLNKYAKVDTLHFSALPVSKQKKLMDTLLTYDEIIVSIHNSNKSPWVKAEIDTEFKNFLNILRLKKKIIVDVFANPYSLKEFLAADFVDGLIMSYQNSIAAQELSAQLIFGGISAKGKLPISASQSIKAGDGTSGIDAIRLKYSLPEDANLASKDIDLITEIVKEGISEKAYPGAQVWIAKDGKVIYDHSFGAPTYESATKLKPTDIYDLASVTKITSSLLALMRLDGEGKLSLDDELGQHLRITKNTPYEKLQLREILAHQAGMAAWIPFYNKTLSNGTLKAEFYSTDSSKQYAVRVAENVYITENYEDTIFYRILKRAKVSPKKEYKYSDVGYYFMKEIVEKISGKSIADYNQITFYEPLGMNRTTFNPRTKFPLDVIVPTEKDNYFRKQQIHGDVHDPGAAMLGGIGGHAGLFSNANDIGKLMQMYLQDGMYAGQRYIKAGKVEEYAQCQYCKDSIPADKKENRRGAGFDKPQFHGNPGPTCECISMNSFGHSGFTGTYAWADPEENLVYVFLSNRVYPDAKNGKLVAMNIRTRIQEKIYDAIANSKFRTSQELLKDRAEK